MKTIEKEYKNPSGGNPLVIAIEIKGKIIEIEITCQICNHKLFWLSEDHSLIYCSKCRGIIGHRYGDFTMTDQVKWKV